MLVGLLIKVAKLEIHVSKLGGGYGQPGFNLFYVGRQYITQMIGNHCTVYKTIELCATIQWALWD